MAKPKTQTKPNIRTEHVGFRTTVALVRQIDKIARRDERSRSQTVERLIAAGIKAAG